MHSQIPHSQNIETIIAERIQSLFITQLGHKPEDVYCRFLDDKLTVIIQNAVTKPEQLLMAAGHQDVVRKARGRIEEILQPQLQEIIEEVSNSQVKDILFATHLDTNYVSIIALFADKCNLTSEQKQKVTKN
ncbi:MAG: Na-translocating system protein MpsC family protein [Nostocales cyanobacterium 94392]|nr:Na-translocating system protein MpsC family protein [Nostocales cyanobacterium 94392]